MSLLNAFVWITWLASKARDAVSCCGELLAVFSEVMVILGTFLSPIKLGETL